MTDQHTIGVVIVENSALIRARLVSMLNECAGVVVLGAYEQGGEAISASHRLRPAAVILDLHLPGSSGLGVLRELKRAAPAPVVIMLTNETSPTYREKCVQGGADFFFDKSREFDQVCAVLAQLREQRAR